MLIMLKPHIAKQMKRDWEFVDGLMLNQLNMLKPLFKTKW
jgi:hypothetical protein